MSEHEHTNLQKESGVGTGRLRDALAEHWLFEMRCVHRNGVGVDEAFCACGKWSSGEQSSVGEAAKKWAEHALVAAPPAAVTDAVIEPSAVGSSMATASDDYWIGVKTMEEEYERVARNLNKALLELCWEIEKLPASEQQTKVVLLAGEIKTIYGAGAVKTPTKGN